MPGTQDAGVNVDNAIVVRKMADQVATNAIELAVARGAVEQLVGNVNDLLTDRDGTLAELEALKKQIQNLENSASEERVQPKE